MKANLIERKYAERKLRESGAIAYANGVPFRCISRQIQPWIRKAWQYGWRGAQMAQKQSL